MVVRLGTMVLVLVLVTPAAGCLTGLGLPPPPPGSGGTNGGGGEPPTRDAGPARDGRPSPDAIPVTGGSGGNGGFGGVGGFGGSGGIAGFGGAGGNSVGGAGGMLPMNNLLEQERWVTRQAKFIDGATWLAGDFSGDGRTDLAVVFNDQGSASIDVWLSTGSTFEPQRWATQQGGFWDTQKWLAGDFDGDGRADLANVFNDENLISIDVHLSNPAGFTQQRWATQQGGFWDAQKWVAGDFDADGRTDLANVFADLGMTSIDVHRSTGAAFLFLRWDSQVTGFWDTQKWLVGHSPTGAVFPDNLISVFNDNGQVSVDVYQPRGLSFVPHRAATQVGGFWDGQKWLAGDFDGDGWWDLADVFDDSGAASADIRSQGIGLQRWMTQEGGFWDAQQWLAGDFDGDGKCDLANVFSDNGLVSIDVHRKSQTLP